MYFLTTQIWSTQPLIVNIKECDELVTNTRRFWNNIQYIAVVDNIVSDKIIIFKSTSVNQDEPTTSRAISRANKSFENKAEKIIDYGLPIYIVIVKR